ncbi:hypothetical protein KI743_01135 [Vibrio sp. D420a]|uniref:hypothetical protein n=1 Tax=Vibrio sp. D420a TaxID=2836895 RepID=UPI0025527A6A|nr:hypothetical protein [Vibrio sp. D420a]MDK9760593.1 hypothetical protein [Vibrio sp. D420a]
MSKLAISKFFEQKLEAPLHNTVWSWGSENAKGIYLRAWNRTKVGDKFDIANVGMETDDDGRTRAGGVERAKHVKAITQGKPGYIVAIDGYVDDAGKSHIVDYNDKAVFRIVSLTVNEQGKTLAEVDYDTPVLIDMIGEETDVTAIMESLSDKPKALATLAKAEKLGWQITGSNAQGVTILLKGKKTGLILYTGEFSAA